MNLTRRRFLALLPPALGAVVLAACGGSDDDDALAPQATPGATSPEPASQPDATSSVGGSGGSTGAQLAPTPACGGDDQPTLAQTQGPYFTPESPERTSLLEAGISGTLLRVSGSVVDTRCEPIAAALVDFWHCDDAGEYDNVGYRLRGHQFTDAAGGYRLETILPGVYPGRTRHIHVKVQAPDQPVLTTQLYFPDEPANASDGIFNPSLVMQTGADGEATFRFVLDV